MASNAMPPQQEIFTEVVQSRGGQVAEKQAAESKAASVYVVSTDNPESTGRDLREYLRNNNIVWDASPSEAMPAPLEPSQQQGAVASRQQQQTLMQLKSARSATASQEERIVARQVTPEQAVALRGWLDRRQSQPRVELAAKDLSAVPLPTTLSAIDASTPKSPQSSSITSALPIEAIVVDALTRAASPTTVPSGENPPTTLPLALDGGLHQVFDFSPPRLDAPGIELDARRETALTMSKSADQTAGPSTTQPQLQALVSRGGATTLPEAVANERVDVVIVLEPQPLMTPAAPATLPATTEPSLATPPQQP